MLQAPAIATRLISSHAQWLATACSAAPAAFTASHSRQCGGARWNVSCALHTSTVQHASTTSVLRIPPQAGGYMQSGQQAVRRHTTPRILITGAGGQVGAELVPFLRQQVGSGNVLASDVRVSQDLADRGPFIYCDVTDKDSLARIILESRVTHVVHLATLLSAIGERNPQLALRVNTVGIQNILDLAVTNQLTVFAPSTIAVFGASTPKIDTPDDTVCEPQTMYGVTKVHQELLGRYFHTKFGVDFRSLRYPGIISAQTLPGGGTTDYAVEMYMAAVLKQPYTCFIHPDTMLPMMYMPDCLRATWELMVAPRESLQRCTYNVTAMSFTPAQLEASIRRNYPDFKVQYLPDFRQDIASTWPCSIDHSAARTHWSWQAEYDLNAMTADMIEALLAKQRAREGDLARTRADEMSAGPLPSMAVG